MTQHEESGYLDRLQSDPAICGGQVCIRGIRIPVSLLLDALAGGDTIEDLLRGYPTLTRDDVTATLLCAGTPGTGAKTASRLHFVNPKLDEKHSTRPFSRQ